MWHPLMEDPEGPHLGPSVRYAPPLRESQSAQFLSHHDTSHVYMVKKSISTIKKSLFLLKCPVVQYSSLEETTGNSFFVFLYRNFRCSQYIGIYF